MSIRIHVFHTGEVCVAPDLPFGGENCNAVKASGVFSKKEDRLWLPVSAYLIEHPKGKFLVDTGWARDMSPNGEFDKKAQIKSLGTVVLYEVNQGRITLSACIDEQLAEMGIKPSDLDAVLIPHLDCDHANGLKQVKGAKKFYVAADEVKFASKLTNKVRYNKAWWEGIPLTEFEWNDTQGPAGKSYDLLGDGSIELINIPGHADGLFAVPGTEELYALGLAEYRRPEIAAYVGYYRDHAVFALDNGLFARVDLRREIRDVSVIPYFEACYRAGNNPLQEPLPVEEIRRLMRIYDEIG